MPPPLTPYASITWGSLTDTLLADRLNSTGTDYWLRAEAQLYLAEALRTLNALTQQYIVDFTATYDPSSDIWQSTGNSLNAFVGSNPTSPRTQTLTTTDLFTIVQYHLLEPPSGQTWTGTPQFTIADFAQSLQRRRDVVLQLTGCYIGPFADNFGLPLGSRRVYLPDSTSRSILDIRRIRYVPATNLSLTPPQDFGPPSTLYREDGLAFEYFENDFTVNNADVPFAWDVLAGPPLALTFDAAANVPNTLDILAMISGGDLAPPTAAPLFMPDDWAWVLKWGMLSDLLRKDSEATDLERADYAEKRFQEGVQAMMELPWLLQARINNLPVDTPSVAEMDTFSYEWQSDPDAQLAIVRGGIDLFALSPNPQIDASGGYGDGGYGDGGYGGTGSQQVSVTMSLVGNMPIPTADDQFVQISRDQQDYVLDYAQHLSYFKQGGFEFAESTRVLYKSFIQGAITTNKRLDLSGIFASTLRPPVSRQDANDPRFATAGDSK